MRGILFGIRIHLLNKKILQLVIFLGQNVSCTIISESRHTVTFGKLS